MRVLILGIAVYSATALADPIYYAPFDKGGFIHLTDEPGIASCPAGTKRAAETKAVLDQLKVIRELCYTVNDKRAVVELKDPEKLVFRTFSIPASKFTRIPTKKERQEAERQEGSQALVNAINQSNAEMQKNRQQLLDSSYRSLPITCIKINHDMMSCD